LNWKLTIGIPEGTSGGDYVGFVGIVFVGKILGSLDGSKM